MRITRLELHGFKSFADRTVFSFGSGVSCVVGPNGCGKSNVVDALRWCMGEQSAKSLRGGEMQDVIFAGSAERKPVGYAEVAITLETTEALPFPGDLARFTEVQVARRLYRSGASEYLINQARARRKDIVDLFMDSGAGNDLYAFIEQGRIDKVVSASSADRRSLLDEAAGITRYLRRREEALSKLEATNVQLDRAADVVDELGRRLRTLERQAVAAARFRRARALLRQDEIVLALVKLAGLDGELAEVETRARTSREALVAREADAEEARDEAELRRAAVEEAEAAAEAAQDAFSEVDGARREIAARQEMHGARAAELAQAARQARDEEAAAEVEADAARQEAVAVEAALAADQAAQAEVEASASAADAALAAVGDAAGAARAAWEAAEQAAREASDARVACDTEHAALAAQRQDLPARIGQLDARIAQLDADRTAASKRAEVADAATRDRIAARDAAAARRGEAEEALEALLRRDHHARDAVQRAERALDAAQQAFAELARAAEHTAGEAHEVIAARVARVRVQHEEAVRAARREADAAIAAMEDAARRELAEADAAARAAHAAVEAEDDRQLAAWRQAQEAVREAEDRALAEAEDAAAREGAAAVTEAERAASEAWAARRAARDAALAQAESALAAARQAFEDAAAARDLAARKLAQAQGHVAALEAEDAASRRRDAGTAAVLDALGDVPRLVDLWGDPPADAAAALGRRLVLPVLDADGVLRAADVAREAGRAEVMFLDGDPASRLDGVAVFDTLADALAHHRAAGGAAAVRQTGERVEPDGLVSLGPDDAAGAALDRREALDAGRAQLVAREATLREADAALLAARSAAEGARIAVRKASERRDAEESEGRAALEAAGTDARAAAAAAVERARAARAAARVAAREALDAGWQARVAALAQAREGRATASAEASIGRRQAWDDRLRDARAQADASEASARSAAEAHVAAAADTIRAEVLATTRDVVVRREQAAATVETARDALTRERARADEGATALAAGRRAVEEAERVRAAEAEVVARLQAERVAAQDQRDALAARHAEAVAEREVLVRQLHAAETGLVDVAARLDAARLAEEAARTARDAARAQAAAASADLEGQRDARDAAVAARAGLRERIAGASARHDAAVTRAAMATARAEAARDRLAEAARARDDADAARRAAGAEVEAIAARVQAAGTAREGARLALREAREARDAVERRVAAVEDGLGALRQDTLDAEQEAQRLSMARAQLVDRLHERHDVVLSALLASLQTRDALRLDPSPEAAAGLVLGDKVVEPVAPVLVRVATLSDEDAVRARVASAESVREELSRLGEVHLGALDEFGEVAGRHAELEGQRVDLDASVTSIREAIAQLNETCKDRFRDAFERVDAAFRVAYPELVGGGEARLELTDEEDLLHTGVEILVRPPGKRMQNLTLLSGGEKAMTAIALLLALFTVKPSPFCVLDEVDAPLDEANGARFNDMIRRMAAKTQFIVITHNRKTMECADALYGITMRTPGCSSLVSVQVD